MNVINYTGINHVSIFKEVETAFNFLPKEMSLLAAEYNLTIIYDNKIVANQNGKQVAYTDSAGLFVVDKKNGLTIHVLVNDYITAADRVQTLMHELGHFIDYVLGELFVPEDEQFWYGMNFYSYADEAFDELDELMKKIFMNELYETFKDKVYHFTTSKHEQFAQYFSMHYYGVVTNYIKENKGLQLFQSSIEQLMIKAVKAKRKQKFINNVKEFFVIS